MAETAEIASEEIPEGKIISAHRTTGRVLPRRYARLLGFAQGLTVATGSLCFCAWIGLTLGALLRLETGYLPAMLLGIACWALEFVLYVGLEKQRPQDKSAASVIDRLRKRSAANARGRRSGGVFNTVWLTERGVYTFGSEYFPWEHYEAFSVEPIWPRLHRITLWRAAKISLAEVLDSLRSFLLTGAGIAVEFLVGIGGLNACGPRNDVLAALFLGCLMLIVEGAALNTKLGRWRRSPVSRRVAGLTLLADANAVSREEIIELLRKHLGEER